MEKIKLPDNCPACHKEWFVHKFDSPDSISYDCRKYGKQDHNFRFHCKNGSIQSIEIEIQDEPWFRAYFYPNEGRLFVLKGGWMIFEQFTYEGSSKEEYKKLEKEKIIHLTYFEPNIENWQNTVAKIKQQMWCPMRKLTCQPPEDWDGEWPFICIGCGHTISGAGG